MLQNKQDKDALVNILTNLLGKSSEAQIIFKSMQLKNQGEPVSTKKWINNQLTQVLLN